MVMCFDADRIELIFCGAKVDGDVNYDGNVKTIEGYLVENFEVASYSSFYFVTMK